MLYIDYSAPKRETEYCDEHELVCLSVCLSVHEQ